MIRTDRYEIVPDLANDLIRITLRGHWDLRTVDDYKAAITDVTDGLYRGGRARGSLLVLVDAREGGAQSQEVIAYYQRELGGGTFKPRRLATIVTSALFKRQIERIAAPNQRLFTDEQPALAWLLRGDPE